MSTQNSVNLTLSGATGSGTFVGATSPTLVTPVLGVATATSINGAAITSTNGTLTLANGSSLITSGANPITLTSTGTTNVTLPTSGTLISSAHNGLATAWGYVTNDGTATLVKSYNIASVNRTGAGVVVVTFSAAMADANYAVVTSTSQDNAIVLNTSANSTTTFTVTAYQADGGDNFDANFSFAVFGT